jgi:hypothetical protein
MSARVLLGSYRPYASVNLADAIKCCSAAPFDLVHFIFPSHMVDASCHDIVLHQEYGVSIYVRNVISSVRSSASLTLCCV